MVNQNSIPVFADLIDNNGISLPFFSNYVTINSNQSLYLDLNCSFSDSNLEIKQVFLYLFENGNTNVTPSIYLSNNLKQTIGDPLTYQTEVVDNKRKFIIDITNKVLPSFNGHHYFLIKSNVNVSLYASSLSTYCPYGDYLTINKHDYYYYQYHEPRSLNYSLSDDSLEINLFTGNLNYKKTLYSISNELFAFDLVINYHLQLSLFPSNINNLNLPIGWKFSFQQFINQIDNDYVYIDNNNKKHVFSGYNTYSNYRLYYPKNGDYLLLKKYSDYYVVLLPDKESLFFDSSGRLIKHVLNKGNNDVFISFNYGNNNKISTITLSNNNSVQTLFVFEYIYNYIFIKPYNDVNKAFVLILSNDLQHLDTINNARQESTTFSYNSNLLSTVSYKNIAYLLSYNDKKVSSVTKNDDYYYLQTHYVDSEQTSFTYYDKLTKTETVFNNFTNYKKVKVYQYDDSYNSVHEYSIYNDNIDGAISCRHSDNKHQTFISNSKNICVLLDSNNNPIDYDNNPIILTNSNEHTLNVQIENVKVLTYLYLPLKTNSSSFSNSVINVCLKYLDQNNNWVSFYSENITFKSADHFYPLFLPIKLQSDLEDYDIIQMSIKRISGSNHIEISQIKLLISKEETYDVSNLGGNSLYLANEDSAFSQLNGEYSVVYGNNQSTNKTITYFDLMMSLIINHTYNLNLLFCNDGHDVINNVVSVSNVALNNIKVGRVSYSSSYFTDTDSSDKVSGYNLACFYFDVNSSKYTQKKIHHSFSFSDRDETTNVLNLSQLLESSYDDNLLEGTVYHYNSYNEATYQTKSRSYLAGNNVLHTTYQNSIFTFYNNNGETIAYQTTYVDANSSFDIAFTYNSYSQVLSTRNVQNNAYLIYYNYYDNGDLKEIYLLDNNDKISKTNITYLNGDICSIDSNFLSYVDVNEINYTYGKSNEVSSTSWNNDTENCIKYVDYSNFYDDLVNITLKGESQIVTDLLGRKLSSSLSNNYLVRYFYRDRSQTLEDVLDTNNTFNGCFKNDQILGGEIDYKTNLTTKYIYNEYDNLSQISTYKTSSIGENEEDYVCYTSYAKSYFYEHDGVFQIDTYNYCLHRREEMLFNNLNASKGFFKVNKYFSNNILETNPEKTIFDQLYHDIDNPSDIYNENISIGYYCYIHEFNLNEDVQTDYYTSYIKEEIFTISNNVKTISYSYNSQGKLSSIYSSSIYLYSHSYNYANNRLISDSSPNFGYKEYSYDSLGNLLSIKKDNVVTYSFAYNNSNQITSMTFNNHNYTFAYDSKGYPTTYKDLNTSFDANLLINYGSISFDYDSYGRRIKKTKPLTNNQYQETRYIYHQGKLIYEIREIKEQNNPQPLSRNVIEFIHGAKDIIGFIYQNNYYVYHKDVLGNVIGIYLNDTMIASYDYDAYGNFVVRDENNNINNNDSFIGNINPYRYRGYYYDSETGLYYLNYRYYDKETCRFISPDDLSYIKIDRINGTNIYIYCYDDPISYKDETGHLVVSVGLFVGLIIAGFVIGFAGSVVYQGCNYGWENINELTFIQAGIDGLFCAASVALSYTGISLLGSVLAGAVLGFGQYAIDSAFHDDFTIEGAITATVFGAISGWASGKGVKYKYTLLSGSTMFGREPVVTYAGTTLSVSLAKKFTGDFLKSFRNISVMTIVGYSPIPQYVSKNLFDILGI